VREPKSRKQDVRIDYKERPNQNQKKIAIERKKTFGRSKSRQWETHGE